MKVLDLTGQKFGRLTVVGRAASNAAGRATWSCRCDCGAERVVLGKDLRSGGSTSCGCRRIEVTTALGRARRRHGQAQTGSVRESPTYKAWKSMLSRCGNPENASFARYGGRGITVCDRWRDSFEAFVADVGERPSPRHSLDRFPSNDGNYEPGNVRWATASEQARNRSSNVRYTVDGETLTAIEWAERAGITKTTLQERLRRGWSLEEAVGRAPRKGGR